MQNVNFKQLQTVSNFARELKIDKTCIWNYIKYLDIEPIERKLSTSKVYCYLTEEQKQQILDFLKTYDVKTRKNILQRKTLKERYGDSCYNNREKTKQTFLKKYGTTKPQGLETVKNKQKETLREKYGEENYRNIEKAKQTCLERYGVEHAAQNNQIKEKTKKYFEQKYGVDNPRKSEEIKNKTKKILIEKYGENYINVFREKAKQTNIERFGVPYPIQNKDINLKARKTFFKNRLKHTVHTCSYLYENISFDSSWELAVWIWAKDNNFEIEREPISFIYEFGEYKHTYTPDFKLNNNLIEIKGDQFFKENKFICPYNRKMDKAFEAKYKCALAHNVVFWKWKEIKPIMFYIQNTYGKNHLKQFKLNKKTIKRS